jgi:hypothetical protein
VTVRFAGTQLVAGVGRRSAGNVAVRPDISLLWPPVEPDGFSLILDARGSVAGETLTITPGRAVLHRQRADGPGSDCVRLD